MSAENNIPDSWQRSTLPDCCTIVLGQSPSSATYNTEGKGLAFFQGKAEFGPLYPTPGCWCSDPSKVAEPDDVLLSIRAPVGPTNLAPARCCIGRGLAAIRPNGGILNRFMLYAFRSIEKNLDELGTGTTFKAITGSVLRSLSIPVAPVREQRRIVEEIDKQFTRLDAGVAALKRVEANLRRYKAAVLKAAVEGRLTQRWRAEHPDVEPPSELLKRILTERRRRWEQAQLAKMQAKGKPPTDDRWKKKYKEPIVPEPEALPRLPTGWKWVTLGQLCLVQQGFSKSPRRAPTENVHPYLRVANVLRGRLDLADVQPIRLFEGELETMRLQRGDLLIVEGNGSKSEIGRSALWNGEIADCVHQNHIIRARAIIAWAAFIDAYWNSPPGNSAVMAAASSTSGLYTLSVSKVSALPVPLPPLAEQQAIVNEVEERLSSLAAAEEAVTTGVRRASRLRQSILKRAFEGKLVPQDPTDEPASVLLDRIRSQRAAEEPRRARSGPGVKRVPRRKTAKSGLTRR